MTSRVLSRTGLARMRPRDPQQAHRPASSLELFFDLTFVVCVSVAAQQLFTQEEAVHWAPGLLNYVAVFFAVWWAWVNFTWFASAFDTDDWLYRVMTIVQMGGVLVVAGGAEPFFAEGDSRMIVVGYVVMRLAMVAQWLRASRAPEYRTTALRYAVGVAAVQALWVLRLLVPAELGLVSFFALVVLELAVPVWAERSGVTPSHPRHIAERYALFTLIVLGEGLLSITNTLIGARSHADQAGDLLVLGATALVLIAGMWWTYFAREARDPFASLRGSFVFGYLHYVVFAAAAALASGLELGLERTLEPGGHLREVPDVAVRAAATLPVALFLLSTWLVVLRTSLGAGANRALPALAVVAGATALLPGGVQWCALVVVAVVVVLEADRRRTGSTAPD